MNKILMGIAFLLGIILIIVNFAAGSGSVHLIIQWSNSPGMLAVISITIGVVAGFSLKGFLIEKGGSSYDNDSGINF